MDRGQSVGGIIAIGAVINAHDEDGTYSYDIQLSKNLTRVNSVLCPPNSYIAMNPARSYTCRKIIAYRT